MERSEIFIPDMFHRSISARSCGTSAEPCRARVSSQACARRSSRARSIGGTEQLARSRATSSSASLKAFFCGDDTESTPMALPPARSGSTSIEAIRKPWPPAETKRGSFDVSSTRAGTLFSSTHPAMPSPTFSANEMRAVPRPERAVARSCMREASRSRIEA